MRGKGHTMRKEGIADNWRVAGRINGAVQEDVSKEVALPFALQSMQEDCSREGLFLRTWELARVIQRPDEAVHSHAERTLLTMDGVQGKGQLLIGGQIKCELSPHMEVDMSEEICAGSCLAQLRFEPHFPQLRKGERGRDLPVETAVFSAHVRNIYLLRIENVEINDDVVRVRMYAYGAGKVRICLRLIDGDNLLWSQNITMRVHVGAQVIEQAYELPPECNSALMRVTIDMGGECCDEASARYVRLSGSPQSFAHFHQMPTQAMLAKVKRAGFEGVIAIGFYAHEGLREMCDQLALHLASMPADAMGWRVLLRPGSEQEVSQQECCLVAPLSSDDAAGECTQAEKMSCAAAALRRAGRAVHVLAYGRQRDAQDGLFDAQGEPRAALYALKNVLGRVAVACSGEQKVYYPYAQFSADVQVFVKNPDNGAAIVKAALYLWSGVEVATRSFTVSLADTAQTAGVFAVQLPWECRDGLVLRMQCWRGNVLVAQSHAYYACTDENGTKKEFPLADVTEGVECEGRVLYNASNAVAMGVTVLENGEAILRHGALLPMERVVLAQSGDLVVNYGNPIEKGGADVVSQRILRGVFDNRNAANGHTQAGSR